MFINIHVDELNFFFTFVTFMNTIYFVDVHLFFFFNLLNTTKCSILHVHVCCPVYVAFCCLTKDKLVLYVFLKLSPLALQRVYKDMQYMHM